MKTRAGSVRKKAASSTATDADDVVDIAEEFFWAKMRLLRTYQFRDRDNLAYFGVSATQCYVLAAVIRAGEIKLQQLCNELSFESSTATRVLDGMVEAGLVKRQRSAADGREVLIHATSAGLAIHDRIAEHLIEQDRELLSGFEPAVQRGIVDVLLRLSDKAIEQTENRDVAPNPKRRLGGRVAKKKRS